MSDVVMPEQYSGPSALVHCHNHTQYSVLDGVATVAQYAEQCQLREYPAMCITEHGHMASVPDAYHEFKKRGVKFIAGCEIYYSDWEPKRRDLPKITELRANDYELYLKVARNRHLTVLAKNQIGYHNLIRLTTQAYSTGLFGVGRTQYPRIWFEKLCEFKEGLIILSGCLNGPVCHELRTKQIVKRDGTVIRECTLRERCDAALAYIKRFHAAFGDDYYIELQMPGIPDDDVVFRWLVEVADKYHIPYVLANDCCHPDTQITTNSGLRPIDNVAVGDKVLTHRGRYRTVEFVNRRMFTGELVCVKVGSVISKFTDNHPVAICENNAVEYIPASQLKTTHRLFFPKGFSIPITKLYREPYSGSVVNLQVAEDETYCVANFATHNCHYLDRSDHILQMIMMAVTQGTHINDPELFHVNSSEQYMKTRAELWATFCNGKYSKGIDGRAFELMCDNTLAIAEKCQPLYIDSEPKIPEFGNADRQLSEFLAKRLKELGLHKRTERYPVDGKLVTYVEQAQIELQRVVEKGFSSYFLITQDLVRFGKSRGYPFAPRGSAGGFLICYLLGISTIDPLRWGLSSERFMSPSRGGYMLNVRME